MVRCFRFGPCRPGLAKSGKAFLVAWIGATRPHLANNKTAAFAGRCFEDVYRGGWRARQSTLIVKMKVKIIQKQQDRCVVLFYHL
jgi:hypothetical protein